MNDELQEEYMKTVELLLATTKEAEKRMSNLSGAIAKAEEDISKTYNDKAYKFISKIMFKRWAIVVMIASAVIAAMYGIHIYQSFDIESMLKQKKEINEEIRSGQDEIERQKRINWGLQFREIGGDRIIIISKDTIVDKFVNKSGQTVITLRKNTN